MNTTQESTFDQDLSSIVSQLPAPVRAFFVSGKVEIVAKNLMQKYQLHIDQGAIMEREIILLLLGLKNPTEFIQALVEEAEIDQQTVNKIVQDVNTQIFIPLQEEEKKSATPLPSQRAVEPKEYFNLKNKIPLTSPKTLQWTVIPTAPLIKAPVDEKLLEDHEEPHIEINHSSHEATKGTVNIPNPLPKVMPQPPANLPGALRPAVVRQPTDVGGIMPPPPLPPQSKPTTPANTIPKTPAKPYSVDPYREPIE